MAIYTPEIKGLTKGSSVRINSAAGGATNDNQWIKLAELETLPIDQYHTAAASFLITIRAQESNSPYAPLDHMMVVNVKYTPHSAGDFYAVGTGVSVSSVDATNMLDWEPAEDIALLYNNQTSSWNAELWMRSKKQYQHIYGMMLYQTSDTSQTNPGFILVDGDDATNNFGSLPASIRNGADDADVAYGTLNGKFSDVAVGMLRVWEEQSSTPAAPTDGTGGIIYVKNDGKLYFRSNEVAETNLGTITSADVTQVTSAESPFLIANSKVGIGTAPEATDALFNVINTGLNALTDVSTMANYHMHLEGNSASASGVGLAMGSSGQAGSAIIFKDIGSWSRGELQFYTKASQVNGAAPVQRMVISADGNIGLGTASPRVPLDVYESGGLILGYTSLSGGGTSHVSYAITDSYAVPTTNWKVTFVAPASGNVEIQFLGHMASGGTGDDFIYLSLSTTGGSYTSLGSEYEREVWEADEDDNVKVSHSWLLSGLSPGASYVRWVATYCTSGANQYWRYGGTDSNKAPRLTIRAISLPNTILTD